MSSLAIVIIALISFLVAYVTYGAWVAKKMGIDPLRKTPAHSMGDGVDYVPAKAPVLLGHHFASIAGASPIIGPITAAVFGWIPAFLWIVLGGIFFGAVHDFTSLFASVRHKGKSIGQIINENVGATGKKLFNIFAWLTLVLIIAVFAIITANTFVAVPSAGTASLLFILVAVIYGFAVYRSNVPALPASLIGIALLFVSIWVGLNYPIALSFSTWIYILLIYIVIGSIAPVWVLLQPRDYLNSYLLYSLLAGAVIGLFLSNPTIQLVGYAGFKTDLGYLFPVLFVTIACGAISGFHSLVSSGTTSKQLNSEKDAKLIGFGGMLIESTLAVIALITAAMLIPADYKSLMTEGGGPVALFSAGVGQFLTKLGIALEVGKSFTALVVSAFALTTLDTATRLGRFIFQELFEKEVSENQSAQVKQSIFANRYVATLVTVVFAGLLALSGQWKAIWPIFGSANQLLAAIALLAVSVWLAKLGKNNAFTKYPMVFMFLVTLSALGFLIYSNLLKGNMVLVFVGAALFILAVVLVIQSFKALTNPINPESTKGDSTYGKTV
ncbi:carbon starvation protein A [Microaerobacter geothermalis]|uniref:carbon starvation CstA family protein n=1 Tax=Microaerobacter geothermalis TaxID=674972 RepID=UPI001F3683B0|nr:carbon starvation protein A [Microaerobacter geothermalis]MCF6094989.1 carbon starvation protein A [Microaerobacter geothermalis]